MQNLRLMALGGLDENGKNMYLIEIDKDIFVVEAGISYPSESEQLGIEYIIPDFSYLIENKDRVKAIFVSHAHDDVMKAISHLIKEIDLPIYCTALTAKAIDDEFTSHNIKKHINIIKRKDTINVDGHIIHSFPQSQSIPDGVGFSFETDMGQVVYTSDFIIDCDYKNQMFSTNIDTLTEIGKKGVFILLSESSGSSRSGFTSPKHRISDILEHHFETIDGRCIITLYKQNIYRILEILETAKAFNKKVFFYDKEHVKLLKHLEDLGYYKIPKGVLCNINEFNNSLDDVVLVVSGQGSNVFRIMSTIAMGDDRVVELNKNDTVIIASPVVPGCEKDASTMEDNLYKADVRIIKLNAKEVLSVHASIEDIKMMISFIKPKYYMPVAGEYAALVNNADIATDMGYTPDRIVILDNGQFAQFENGRLVSTRDLIELNDTPIDMSNSSNVSSMVLKDRESLSTDGVIVVGVVIDHETKQIIGGPDVQSRGVIYLKDADHILNEIGNIIIETINGLVKENRFENMQARLEAKEAMSRYVLKETGKKPMILPAIVEIKLGDNNG